ncbi:MAG: hypothetical protein ACHP9Z_34545, partial [Streptosporangiales bacterium]
MPGLDTAAAQRVLATARTDHGRALREVDALLKEHPGALVTTPAAYPLALVRLAHALIEAGYQTVAAPACAGCGKITAGLRCKTTSGRVCEACAARGSQQRTVAGTTDDGPVCASCYQAPQRPCGRRGRTRKIATRATASTPDLCYSCCKGAVAVCSVCEETRPCQRISSGRPICRTCRARPPRPCFRCGRARPVQAEWPAGPVCAGCYE